MKKNKKCLGCGILLQSDNVLKIGYTPNLDNEYCMRCFKFQNYGSIVSITNDQELYKNILKNVSLSKDLVLYVVDILNIRENLDYIYEYLKNKVILVLNKKDILPKSIKDEKIINYIKERYDFLDIVIVSSRNNYNMDLLYKKINKHKISENVYVVGETNAGKSSLINKIVSNYSKFNPVLTTSIVPETTLNKISIQVNDKLNLIDTPGLVDKGNIINYLNQKYYKILNTKREIRPKTYAIYKGQSILVGDFLRIDYLDGDKNSFTFYVPNEVKIKKINSKHDNLKDLAYREYDLKFHEDLVIYGLGFVKCVIEGKIGIYLNIDIKTFIRNNLI